ncbi:MAG: hypothetical protein DRH30_00485 [Deltaproteobacteria bacterium]|nr:MAG: hypothetical protein DRH30_00485 [Deltaproteobacteria bacterium]
MKPATRVVTFEAIDGTGFRLITPFGNRDFDNGILSTDDNDPGLVWLMGWAANQKGIKVTDTGVVTQVAVKTCPICGQQVGSDAELADHNEAVHVQPESKGQRTTRRRKS